MTRQTAPQRQLLIVLNIEKNMHFFKRKMEKVAFSAQSKKVGHYDKTFF